ncbi:MAG: FkbM family methyltransferase [Solirubrobacteraceae bacterium]
MTELLRERGAFERSPVVLIDVGAAGGIDHAWRAFGPSLVARGYDPDVAACEQANANETFPDVRYYARYVGLEESHPFVQRRRVDASRWPNTNIWERVTAGYMAQHAVESAPGAPRRMAEPGGVIGVDEIVRTERLPTVDFLKVDVDGPDLEVLESARDLLENGQLLGVGMEVNWFGTANPTEHTFHNTDRLLREHGFALFGLTQRSYSRTALPAPFEYEFFAQTLFGQPYQGDALYLRDLAAEHLAEVAAGYPPDKLIKLACMYEMAGLPDCAAEVLNRFAARLAEFGNLEPLLDALTPPLLGEQLSYREYIARFEREPQLFLPSARAQPTPPEAPTSAREDAATAPSAVVAPSVPHRVGHALQRGQTTIRALSARRVTPTGVAARLRSEFLERAPRSVVRSVAARLGHIRPLALEPGWHLRVPDGDESQLTLLKRDIWAYFRQSGVDAPIVFRWYDDLRIMLYLGNDLSLCLYVLGAFEPNEFAFLRSALGPGMVVLDGGANEGLFSLYSARRVGSGGSVLAVEPSTREFERLAANVALNRLDNVKTFKVALGSHPGDGLLAVAEARHAGMNALDAGDRGQGTAAWTVSREAVSLETIDTLVTRAELGRLDLIKLDIEGSEVDALHGAKTTIARFQPTILLEAESERLAGQGRTKNDLARALDELGYETWVFEAGTAQLRRGELASEPDGNAIAAPRGWQAPVLA